MTGRDNEFHLRAMVDGMVRAGHSEREVIAAVERATGRRRPRSERRMTMRQCVWLSSDIATSALLISGTGIKFRRICRSGPGESSVREAVAVSRGRWRTSHSACRKRNKNDIRNMTGMETENGIGQ